MRTFASRPSPASADLNFVAAAESPSVAVAVLQLQSDLWWVRSSKLGADVLSAIFCEGRDCRPELASRYTRAPELGGTALTVLGLREQDARFPNNSAQLGDGS